MKKDLFSQFKRALASMKEQDLTEAKGLLMEVKDELLRLPIPKMGFAP